MNVAIHQMTRFDALRAINLTCYIHGLSGKLDQVKRTDQLTRQYKTNPNPNPKYVLIRYVTNAGLFFSLDPAS